MELSYDEIRRIHRLEKNTAKLVPVEPGFYSDLQEFLAKEKQDYLVSLRDFSSSKARDFTNLKKMVEEIFSLRTKKLLGAALAASRTNEAGDEPTALQEQKVFRELLSLLERHNRLLGGIFSEKKGDDAGRDLNTLSVEILSDIPEFVGTDMKEYGPFRKGGTAKLPAKIARLLSSQKLAETKE